MILCVSCCCSLGKRPFIALRGMCLTPHTNTANSSPLPLRFIFYDPSIFQKGDLLVLLSLEQYIELFVKRPGRTAILVGDKGKAVGVLASELGAVDNTFIIPDGRCPHSKTRKGIPCTLQCADLIQSKTAVVLHEVKRCVWLLPRIKSQSQTAVLLTEDIDALTDVFDQAGWRNSLGPIFNI